MEPGLGLELRLRDVAGSTGAQPISFVVLRQDPRKARLSERDTGAFHQ